jgi:acyl dehydratase
LANVGAFARAVGWGGARFESHEGAREEGFPGALVPGIMGMGFLTSAIHQWAPSGQVEHVDTVFRAPMLADTPAIISAVVTDIDEDEGIVELDMTVKNTKDETRVFGTAKVRLPLS